LGLDLDDITTRINKMMDEFEGAIDFDKYLNIPVSPLELDEYVRLMDKALERLDPVVKDVFKRMKYIYDELGKTAYEKGILSQGLIQKFYKDLGVAYVPREPLKNSWNKIRKVAGIQRQTIESRLATTMKAIEEYFTDLFNKGIITEDELFRRVPSLKEVAKKIADAKLYDLYHSEDLFEFFDEMRKLIREIPNAEYRIGASRMLNKFRQSVGDITRMRKTVGTIKSIEELVGEELFEKNLAKLLFKQELKLKTAFMYQQYLEDMVKNSAGLVNKWSKGMGKPPEGFVRLSHKAFGDFVVHKDIVRGIEEIFKIMDGSPNNFVDKIARAYDKGLGIWKYIQLIPRFKFHNRNLISEVILNKIAGMSPLDPAYLKAFKLWVKAMRGDPAAVKEYANFMRMGIVGGGFIRSELGSIGKAAGITYKFKKIPVVGHYLHAMETFGQFAEDIPRMAMYYWLKRKGLNYVAKFGFDDIVKAVRKFHPVYDEFTAFEQQFMRRLFPFYSWLRFNMPLHMEMMIKNPKHYARLERLRRAVTMARGGELPEDDPYAPEYIKKGYAIGWSKRPGTRYYLVTKGWLPEVEIGDLFDTAEMKDLVVRHLTPLKIVPETIWGYDTFRKRRLPAYPGEKRKLFGIRVDPRIHHIVTSIAVLQDLNKIFFPEDKRGAKFLDRLAYAMYGKAYKVDVEKSRKFVKRMLQKAKSGLKYGIKRAEYNRDYKTVKLLKQKIKEIDRELVKL